MSDATDDLDDAAYRVGRESISRQPLNPSPTNQPDHDGQLARAEGLTAQGHEADNRCVFARQFAMANKWTFTIKPIAQLLAEEVGSGLLIEGLWCDPFAGMTSPAQVTNDLNPNTPTTHHEDALTFLKRQPEAHFDGVLYDPPYSFRQAQECYEHYGKEKFRYSSMKYWSDCKKEVARIVKPGGKVICFGWNTMGIGKTRGFAMQRVLLVPHGGNRNDTMVTVEVTA